MASKRCYYEVLGVSRDADDDTIKRTFRKRAFELHPDRNVGDPDAEARFKEVNEAYEVLRDPQKRQRYDRYGHAGLEGMGGMPGGFGNGTMEDLFEGIFGGIFGGRGRRGPQAGRDLQIQVEIDLVEAANGVSREINLPREETCNDCGGHGGRPGSQPATCRRCGGRGVVIQGQGFFRVQQTCGACGGRGTVITDPCPKCRGGGFVRVQRTVTVNIPPGVDNDMSLRLAGEGESGEPGAPPGDLYCVLRVKKHPFFARDGQDLHCEVPISIGQAALGGTIEVPTLDGKLLQQPLKRGSQYGDKIRIAGQGMPNVRGGRKGDLIVHLKVEVPRHLTKRQEELLREFEEIDGHHPTTERKSFLDRVREFFTPSEGSAS
jgi:molecular chaperone DnaJ